MTLENNIKSRRNIAREILNLSSAQVNDNEIRNCNEATNIKCRSVIRIKDRGINEDFVIKKETGSTNDGMYERDVEKKVEKFCFKKKQQ